MYALADIIPPPRIAEGGLETFAVVTGLLAGVALIAALAYLWRARGTRTHSTK